jgi:hypothetical protein
VTARAEPADPPGAESAQLRATTMEPNIFGLVRAAVGGFAPLVMRLGW